MNQLLEKIKKLSMPGRVFLTLALLADAYILISGTLFSAMTNMLIFLAFNLFIYFICFMDHDHLNS